MRKLLVIALLAAATSLIPAGVAAERLPNSLHGGDPFSAVLTGHGSGTSRVTLNPGQREVCWEVTVSGLTAPVFASHIHKGGPDVNGPIVVPFFNTGFNTPRMVPFSDQTSTRRGCWSQKSRRYDRATQRA